MKAIYFITGFLLGVFVVLAILGIKRRLYRLKSRREIKPVTDRLKSMVRELIADSEVFRQRAEWAELYAGQLEKELGIPAEDRMDSNSWKQAKKLNP